MSVQQYSVLAGLIVSVIIVCAKERSEKQNAATELVPDSTSSYFTLHPPKYPRDCHEVLTQCHSVNSSEVHLIRPDGYPEPFEVYCDNVLHNGGWTVIQRRMDGLYFNRTWQDYKLGFGFPSGEFWLGNEKLSYLTNQKIYQLRLELTTSNGSLIYVIYDGFRISDDYDMYKLLSVGQYNATLDDFIKWCPPNMEYGSCTCCGTCEDPDDCSMHSSSDACFCPDGFLMSGDDCIPREQCSCFIEEANDGSGLVLPEGEVYVSQNCVMRCYCTAGFLTCHNTDHCSCEERDNSRQCYCNEGYFGNGIQCTTPADCNEIYSHGNTNSGVYRIQPTNWNGSSFEVFCRMEDGGGWTVFQRRMDGSQTFFLDWNDYKNGFGSPNRELWLGNEKLYYITNQRNQQLRIDMINSDSSSYYVKYTLFRISNESDTYRLSGLGTFSGNTPADRLAWHKGKPFSTRDRENSERALSSVNCAERHRGAWWFDYKVSFNYQSCTGNSCDFFYADGTCYNCASSHLNGNYDSTESGTNMFWNELSSEYDCGLTYTEMKIRPA